DRHRLELEVIDIGGNDRAAARDLVTHEFGCDELRDRGPEAFARRQSLGCMLDRPLAPDILAMRDIDHLGGHDPSAGEFELGDHLAGTAVAQYAFGGTMRRETIPRGMAVVLRLDRASAHRLEPARGDPSLAEQRQTLGEIDPRI